MENQINPASNVAIEVGPFYRLPSAVTTQIMFLLPIKSIAICRCVQKNWNTLISDPVFIKKQFEQAPAGLLIRTDAPELASRTLYFLDIDAVRLESSFKLPLHNFRLDENSGLIDCEAKHRKFRVSNSCNGLICLYDADTFHRDPVIVCNPITGDFLQLPTGSTVEGEPFGVGVGFAFNSNSNTYKVIRMWCRLVGRDKEESVVEVHTLGTQTWSMVGGVDVPVTWLDDETYVNGALHFIKYKPSIVCFRFDFESEKLESFPSPSGISDDGCTRKISMGEFKGCLCICQETMSDSINVWVMKKYGIVESWTKIFSIAIDRLAIRIMPWKLYCPANVKHGPTVLYNSYNSFVYYEVGKPVKKFRVTGTESVLIEAFSFTPSLFSLKDFIGNGIKVLNVHSRCAKFILPEENEVLLFSEDFSDGEE